MTVIKMNDFLGGYDSIHDYGDAIVQGGRKGLVVNSKDTSMSYRTAFVEAFVDNSFVRGEGKTVEEADDACWDKVVKQRACLGHEFAPRSYTNGSGFCKHCGYFAPDWFSGVDLGQLCDVCGEGCLDFRIYKTEKWYCAKHYPLLDYSKLYYKMMDIYDDYISAEEDELFDRNYQLLSKIVFQVIEPDPAVLASFAKYL